MSAELYPCRRCKTNSEYSDFCSRKCASEWKGFHEQEIEDLQSQLTAAQAEIAKLQSALDVAVEFIESISIRELDSQNVIKRISTLDKIKQIKNSTQ